MAGRTRRENSRCSGYRLEQNVRARSWKDEATGLARRLAPQRDVIGGVEAAVPTGRPHLELPLGAADPEAFAPRILGSSGRVQPRFSLELRNRRTAGTRLLPFPLLGSVEQGFPPRARIGFVVDGGVAEVEPSAEGHDESRRSYGQ